jgi:hypothetical protein
LTFDQHLTNEQMYKDDGLTRADVEVLVDTFSKQGLDFFGHMRAATYDAQILEWMRSVAGEGGPGGCHA